MRKMIPQILEDPGIEAVGTAMDGLFALKKIRELRPDVVTLDIDMPRMDGIETLRRIMAEFGTPVVIVSSLSKRDAELTFRALEIGAFDYVTKPQDAISVHISEIGGELIAKVKAAAENPRARLRKVSLQFPAPLREKQRVSPQGAAERVLAVGISTGGPNALSYLLPAYTEDFPAGILIVQHMPEGFTEMFAVAAERALRHRGERSERRRSCHAGKGAHRARQPPSEGQTTAAGHHRRSVRCAARKRAPAVRGRVCSAPSQLNTGTTQRG